MNRTGLAIFSVLMLFASIALRRRTRRSPFKVELDENGTPANGLYNMAFTLFDDAVGGIVVGTPVVHGAVPVVDGKFAADLDFGGAAFADNRWLEIEINAVALLPRSALTHAPYAIQTRGIFVNEDASSVGIGQSDLPSAPSVVLSVTRDTETDFGGMVVETTGINGKPVYAYAAGGLFRAYHYVDGSTGNWHLAADAANIALTATPLGHMGINQSNPETMLHVKQDVANIAIRTEHQSTANNWDTGIGTTTNNYKFYYNTNFRADISSIDGAYVQASDRGLKQDIQPIPEVLDKVGLLNPASYLYLDNTEGGPRSIGFVAQDVEPLFPDLVRETDDGTIGLVYDGFAVISIKAIQELNTKVDQLEDDNNTLCTRLGALEQLVKQLASTKQENT